jgi:hypothetical protein
MRMEIARLCTAGILPAKGMLSTALKRGTDSYPYIVRGRVSTVRSRVDFAGQRPAVQTK